MGAPGSTEREVSQMDKIKNAAAKAKDEWKWRSMPPSDPRFGKTKKEAGWGSKDTRKK